MHRNNWSSNIPLGALAQGALPPLARLSLRFTPYYFYLLLFFCITFLGLGTHSAYGMPGTLVSLKVPSSFVYPVMGPRKSSGYGMRIHPIRKFSRNHQGVDLAAPIGSPIRAVSDGVVVFADPYAGFGNLVVIKHNDHMTSHYGHCDHISIKPGQRITAGQIIATVGSTGMSTGPHLHFEIRFDGVSVDPEKYFPDLASEAEG